MPPTNMEQQRKITIFDAPTWGYRRGADGEIEKDVFEGVAPYGWTDSPAKVDEIADIPLPPAEDDTPKFNEDGSPVMPEFAELYNKVELVDLAAAIYATPLDGKKLRKAELVEEIEKLWLLSQAPNA